ncbi:HigA family addiction module antitoxin [Streptomyces sp. MN03-5084-2B]|nr:HigA family addiction module antitoxin [Streptomyces sp. MN03-5084-2B]
MSVSNSSLRYDPDYCDPPGETLIEFLDEVGMSQAELARRTGFSVKHVNQICQGMTSLTADAAIRLERITNIRASTWLALESNYQIFSSKQSETEKLQGDLAWLRLFPVTQLKARGWIQQSLQGVPLLRAVLNFFQVATPDAWNQVWATPTAYRVAKKYEPDYGALSSWIRIGELYSAREKLPEFDRDKFREQLGVMRSLTNIVDPNVWLPQLRSLCFNCGVSLVIEKEIPGARVNGVVRWLQTGNPLIQLSLRHSWADIFWFTLFHEVGHLLLHDRKRLTLVDGIGMPAADEEMEREADDFAGRTLIPKKYDGELLSVNTYDQVRALASKIGVHSGIVVGRLQHDGRLRWSQFNDLRVRFKFMD